MSATTRLDTLVRLATGPAANEAALGAKARALGELVREGLERSPLSYEQLLAELEGIASRAPETARGTQAQFVALRALEALEAPAEFEWPSPTPDEIAAPGYWPYDVTPAQWDQEQWRRLDEGVHTYAVRDHWRAALEGPAPWRRVPMRRRAA